VNHSHLSPHDQFASILGVSPQTFIDTPELEAAFAKLKTGSQHVFITGKAGTGKSTLLTRYRDYLHSLEQELVVLAPTGVAALNVDGQTIHSFFQLAPNGSIEEAKASARRQRKRGLYKQLTEIVIDEISMVRADLLDCIDVFLKTVRNSPLPFGGVRMIFFGDLYQLPPVLTRHEAAEFSQLYETEYFFSAKVMRELLYESMFGMEVIELDRVFRQQDDHFLTILNAIRNQEATPEILNSLNARVGIDLTEHQPIVLTGLRNKAHQLNQQHLAGLSGKQATFWADISGAFLKGYSPTDEELTVIEGARVMFTANDSAKRWVNGSLGTVVGVSDQSVEVELDEGETVTVLPYTWEVAKMIFSPERGVLERETIGSFKQLPITIAHAVTIHKAQGKTFDYSVIDLSGGMFAHGQAYVALSRSRSLTGLSLTRPIREKDIIMDRRVLQFIKSLNTN